MSILQVNVRPAVEIRKSVNSQRREETDHVSIYQNADLSTEPHVNQQQHQRSTRSHVVSHSIRRQQSSTLSNDYGREIASSMRQPQLASPSAVNQYDAPALSTIPMDYSLPKVQQTEKLGNGSLQQPVDVAAAPLWQNVVWKLMPATTVGRALNSARERLNEAACSTASLDAQVILAHVLGVDRSWLFAHHEYKLNTTQADAFTDLIARRMRHEPVAYLIGRKEFYGLDFLVDQRVLIPRPETELLVDAVLDFSSDTEQERVVIADVGTGSGAIALSVAHHCERAYLYAIDLSLDALEVAERNITRLDARGQVTLAQGDLLTPLPEQVNVIVANLPYISSDVYSELDVDVRNFEPQVALEAGPEGLDAIHRLLQQVHKYLLPNGAIFLEIGYDQGAAVTNLARRHFPYAQRISVRQDYHGRDRLVTIIP